MCASLLGVQTTSHQSYKDTIFFMEEFHVWSKIFPEPLTGANLNLFYFVKLCFRTCEDLVQQAAFQCEASL